MSLDLDQLKPTHSSVFKCRRCGASGEGKFDWQGDCLICEDGDEELTEYQEEHQDCSLCSI